MLAFLVDRAAAFPEHPTPFPPEIFIVFAMTEKIIPSPVREVNEISLRNIFQNLIPARMDPESGENVGFEAV